MLQSNTGMSRLPRLSIDQFGKCCLPLFNFHQSIDISVNSLQCINYFCVLVIGLRCYQIKPVLNFAPGNIQIECTDSPDLFYPNYRVLSYAGYQTPETVRDKSGVKVGIIDNTACKFFTRSPVLRVPFSSANTMG